MQVNEKAARQMFAAMGLNESKWNTKFLTKKLNNILEMVESATQEPTGDDLSLLRRITESVGQGEKITLEGSEETVSKETTKEKPAKAGKGGKSAATTTKGKDKTKTKTKGKGVQKAEGAGVIGSIVEFLKAASKTKPINKKTLVEKLAKRFPDRDPDAMLKTVNTQVPSRLTKKNGIPVLSGEGGYWIGK